jgi:hypothetical protein
MFTQSDAIDIFHSDKSRRISLAEFMDRQDVWMIEIRDGASFLSEALQAIFVFGDFGWEDFQR